jgi:hypothetical protein
MSASGPGADMREAPINFCFRGYNRHANFRTSAFDPCATSAANFNADEVIGCRCDWVRCTSRLLTASRKYRGGRDRTWLSPKERYFIIIFSPGFSRCRYG